MSIHLKLDDVDFNQPKENNIKLQYIPANVDEATAANIDQYFNNYTTEIDGCRYFDALLLFIPLISMVNFMLIFSVKKFAAWFPIEWLSI